MRESIRRGKDKHSPHLLTLLANRLDACQTILQKLQNAFSDLSPELNASYEKMVSILRSLAAANTRCNVVIAPYPLSDVYMLIDNIVSDSRSQWSTGPTQRDSGDDGRRQVRRCRWHYPQRTRLSSCVTRKMSEVDRYRAREVCQSVPQSARFTNPCSEGERSTSGSAARTINYERFETS